MTIRHRSLRQLFARGAVLSVATSALLVGAVACGGDESGDSTTTTTAAGSSTDGSTTAGETDGACALISAPQVEAAVGATPDKTTESETTKPGQAACYWGKDGKTLVSLTTYSAPVDIAAQEAELKGGLFYDETLPSPGVGEDSFFRLGGPKQTAVVVFRESGTLYYLILRDPNGERITEAVSAAARDKAIVLAKQVLAAAD